MQKLYYGVIGAEQNNTYNYAPVILLADDLLDAFTIAYSAALDTYPLEEGYTAHKAEASEVPDNYLKSALGRRLKS